jgi:predicted lactoylglutathione lyase
VIDFYGSCDESPTSADQIVQQKQDEQFMFGRAYEDGD